jgi:FolB domain-containing protein
VTDSIAIHELTVRTRGGVSEEERLSARPLIVNVTMSGDTRAAGISDELDDTIDYGVAIERIAAMVEGREWGLIEHVAEEIAGLVLQECGAKTVKVEIIKEAPPVTEDVKAVSVSIERETS